MKHFVAAMAVASSLMGAAMWAAAPQAPPADAIQVMPGEGRTAGSGAAANFTGHVRVEQLFAIHDSSRVTGGIVTFEPGARSVWHTHPVGQYLIVTAGSGLVQQWGRPVRTMKAGDVIWIPAGVKHWHGGSPASSVTHLAIQEALDGRVVQWLEPVSDEQYRAAGRG